MTALAGVLLLGGGLVFADWWVAVPVAAKARYVGRDSCIQCHQTESHLWSGSYHDLAMDVATEQTVLGDFNDAEIETFGMVSRMFRDGDKFMIHTEGPDGEMADFEIKYVFGVDPLQQYMVEFDRAPDMPEHEIGRLQVLRISWDTHRKKWFYLPPPDVDDKLHPDDDLHWTGIAQNWNTMCADCHSTNLQKNFDVATKRYHTTFSEIDVSCESCHGPGSLHVDLATAPSLFWDRNHGYGLAKLKSLDHRVQIQTCAQCHSRRRIVHPDFRPGDNFYDHFSNELLGGLTYHADGQILDEVYVYGSFLQSKMYEKGIRCTDCHDPHSTKVKFEDNQLCTSCHQHPAGKYDTPAHHHHAHTSAGAKCVECHMPSTTYMEVDPRRDHSLRVPRPDLSVSLGTPNACTGCHIKDSELDTSKLQLEEYADWLRVASEGNEEVRSELKRLDAWSKEYVDQWYGTERRVDDHFAHALQAAREGQQNAPEQLIAVAASRRFPAIVRASAIMELGMFPTPESLNFALDQIKDPDPQVRSAAVGNLRMLPDGQLVKHVAPLLNDPVRVVRTEAARVLAHVRSQAMRGPQRQALKKAVEELKAGLMVTNDRAQAHMTLGILYEDLNEVSAAIRAYEAAIHVEPRAPGPRTNLAALLDRLVEQSSQYGGQPAALSEARVYRERAKVLRAEELKLLERDAKLAPDNPMVQYRYGLLLYLHGREEEAEQALLRAYELEPMAADFALAIALLYQKQERFGEALEVARKLLEIDSSNPSYPQLLQTLQQQMQAKETLHDGR